MLSALTPLCASNHGYLYYVFQHKMKNVVWTKGASGLEGEFQSASEVDFYVDKVMIVGISIYHSIFWCRNVCMVIRGTASQTRPDQKLCFMNTLYSIDLFAWIDHWQQMTFIHFAGHDPHCWYKGSQEIRRLLHSSDT